MLHYYMHDGPAAFRFELAGDLDATAAARLDQVWRTAASTIGKRTLIIDLSFVTAIDEAGRRLFRRWQAAGAQFAALSTRSRELIETITGLPFSPQPQKPTFQPWFSLGLKSLPFLALMALLSPSLARAASDDGASLAFARYVSTLDQGTRNTVDVAIHIDASVPKLGKQAQFDAIRHQAPGEEPEYLILRFEGDASVKRDVIARYLAAEQQASGQPRSSLAITPRNYKFRYTGSLERAEGRVYVFTIKPRHRSVGLLDGEIWIDQETGAIVHEAGRMVKPGSVFIRGIRISRDTLPRAVSPQLRVTHVSVETRVFGVAELTIREHPSASLSSAGELQ